MTKLKPPASIEAAIARIAGQLPGGHAEAASIVARTPSTVYAWGDTDREESIPLNCAIALDIAFQKAGGVGSPIRDAYEVILEGARAEEFADQVELARATAELIRENGDAESALILAALPGADDAELLKAQHEAEQSLTVATRVVALVKRLRGRGRAPP